MQKIRSRRILWAVVAFVVAVGLVLAFMPRAVPVDLVEAERGPMEVTLNEEGETRVKETHMVLAPVSGVLDRVVVEAGDSVAKDETVLVRITPAAAPLLDARTLATGEATVEAAAAALTVAEAQLQQARSEERLARADLERMRGLTVGDTISASALERYETALANASAALKAAENQVVVRRAELEAARSALDQTGERTDDTCVTVRAVIDGVVLRVLRENEGVVREGETLVEIGDPNDLEIIADYLSEDAVAITSGDPVIVTGWGGGDIEGRVRRVEPYGFMKLSALGVEEQRVNVVIDFDVPEAWNGRLGEGYRVETRVIVWRADDVVSVPVTAIFRIGGDWAAYVVRGGRARLTRLEIGRMNGDRAEVRTGVEAGDLLVEHPSERVSDGARVTRRPVSTSF